MADFALTRPASANRGTHAAVLLAVCMLSWAGLGCHRRTAKAAPPISNPPAIPAPSGPPAGNTKPTPPPEISPTPPAQPPSLIVPQPKPEPPKPRPASPEPAAPKPEAPQISPQLTPAEQAEAEQQTKKDIDTAENNLQLAYGKQLNAAQHDLVEKIRGFLGQSREAMRAADWVRAKNLAQKARLLSAELVNSL